MRTLRTVVYTLACIMFLFAGSGFTAAKQTVAVLDFESIGSEEFLGKAVAEIIRTELVGTQKFRVVERAQIKKALSEQELQMTGAIDDKSAVQIGKLLGADLIIVGSVVKIGTAYTINSRLLDVQTGEAQLGRNVTGNDLNLLTDMSRTLIGNLFGTTPIAQVPATPPVPAKPATTSPTPVTPRAASPAITWDFEDPDLPGWTKSGDAFDYQPTYGDNPTARRRGQPSNHQGDYWIGGYEDRPHPFDRPGAVQGDGPKGTLTSASFTINTPVISFLIGGGCDISKVRVDLVIDRRVVRSATGKCNETMERKRWDVRKFMGKNAYIKIVDNSSGGWGHINFDDVRFEKR